MRVLCIQHAAPEGPGTLATALTARGIAVDICKPFAGDPVPQALDGYRGLVVMGGPMGVYEADAHPHLGDEMRLIGEALAADLPVLGICLGSQLLAATLGADVHPGPQKEIGWHEVVRDAADDDSILAGAPARFEVLHWHGDVFDLPRGAQPLARSALTAHQAFCRGDAYGLLFHLEVTPAIVAGMAQAFAGELAAAGIAAADLLSTARFAALAPIASAVFARWASLIR